MSHHLGAAPLVLILLSGPALAQDDPGTVGISVAGTVVEVSVAVAAEACGIDAATVLAEWEAMPTEVATMADTSVAADATDLAPDVAADTAMDSTRDGTMVADGADSTAQADGSAASDVASDEVAAAGNEGAAEASAATQPDPAAGDGEAMGTPTDGTSLAKAAVCEVSRETAEGLGIVTGG